MARHYSVQFVQTDAPNDKEMAKRYLAEEALWNAAAELVRQARAAG